ncbi:M23 family metallopeptidase [Micromonospora sp. LOL_023]|uniref:M23 family metallopeptidase n=1 Tax=Micromonospora sp. LOL_023 TaxID=3345418 RepID=UPI003A882D62
MRTLLPAILAVVLTAGLPASAAPVPGVPPADQPPATGTTAVAGWSAAERQFVAPLPGPLRIGRRFDPPPVPWSTGHRGVDLVAGPATTVVVAAGTGTVHHSGRIAGRGVVSVSHPGGLRTTYEPVDGAPPVGATVRSGDPIGLLTAGHPGCPAATCLHWGLRQLDGTYLDPMLLLGHGRSRLLPTGASG